MRLAICAALLIAVAFLAGRATAPSSSFAGSRSHVYTGKAGDVFRVPSAAVRCTVSGEGGRPDLYCAHTPKPRHQVFFFTDGLCVWRDGNPDKPVFCTNRP
ncbi:MAG: hypothetical protein AUG91_10205 [Actinobacteria bacterium 13_1_20CM_4_69_9]|jgi:hypothetical protein|nr:MAG: hypothetical protein AUG91_10205 [Actinobacteria bacterium 13_1_20CM_4_69_9]